MERGLTRNQLISELTRSPHGELAQYVPVGTAAAAEDGEFFSRLIAWNHTNGAVRDAKVALPVIALTSPAIVGDAEFHENALAHILSLDPRHMLQAFRFAEQAPGLKGRGRLRSVIRQLLSEREANYSRFTRTALQHRRSLRELYTVLRVRPGHDYVFSALELKDPDGKRYPKRGVFADLARLKQMSPAEIAGTIFEKKIPFLIAIGALGKKAKEVDVVQALIAAMSPNELVNNTKMLERMGVKSNPALRASYEAALGKIATSDKAVLKTTRAAEAVGGELGEKLRGAQEKQINNRMSVDGNWLVLADRSSSMTDAIEAARHVSAVLARVANGKVHLVFFNDGCVYHDVSGKTLDQITEITKRMSANGSTSIGCGVSYATQSKFDVDGIAIVSDGAENTSPMFAAAYQKLSAALGKEVPVYLFWMKCQNPNDWNNSPKALSANCRVAGIALEVFDLRAGTDYYALPNIVQTMRVNRFALADQIMQTPLLKLSDVLNTVKQAEEIGEG